MKQARLLILVDSIINLFLGIVLMAYSKPIINFFGLPISDLNFYPNILGAILFGIGIALFIEYKRRDAFIGLGLGGAICINMMGGIVLFLWLVSGKLSIPLQGKVILWILDIILIGNSSFELMTYLKNRRTTTKD